MKIQLGVMFGGNSTEHEISIISAVQAMLSLNREKYDVVPLYITKDSRFFTGEALLTIENYKNIPSLLKKCTEVTLVREGDIAGIYKFPPKAFGKSRIGHIDVAFPIVHGTNVEDGVLAGYIEMLGLPYVGCDVASSALGMDKFAMKAVFKDAGIPVLPAKLYTSSDFAEVDTIVKSVEESFTYPVIVKPVNLGSSIGISIAGDRDALLRSLDTAFSFSEIVLVERAVTNLREINCAVLGDRFSAEASECEEPISGDEILSFTDKYVSGAKDGGAKGMASVKRKIPAPLSEEQREQIRSLAVKAFKVLGASGVARIDFMIDCDENKLYLNEINTIPGSLSFYLWEPLGVPYSELLDRMVDLALKRQRERARLTFSFESNVLSGISLGGAKGAKGSKM